MLPSIKGEDDKLLPFDKERIGQAHHHAPIHQVPVRLISLTSFDRTNLKQEQAMCCYGVAPKLSDQVGWGEIVVGANLSNRCHEPREKALVVEAKPEPIT